MTLEMIGSGTHSSCLLAGTLVLSLGSPGCGGKPSTPEAPPPEYEEEFTKGPVSLVVRLDRTKIGLADQLRFEQELRVEEGFLADFPEYLPEDFEGLSVVDIHEEKAEEDGAAATGPAGAQQAGGDAGPRVFHTRHKTFLLEPDRSGQLAILPMDVYFHASGEEEESSFSTEEVAIEVEPLRDVGALAVRPPFDIVPSSGDGGIRRLATVVVVVGLGMAGALAVILLVVRRRRRRPPPRPVPPHEVAWESLRRLVAMDLVGQGEIEPFFVHLSAILRNYIEGRFRLHAPERTTEEFFAEAVRSPALEPYLDRLMEFLRLSDQVKFARYEPGNELIQSSFDALKSFITETQGAPAGEPARSER